MADPHFSPSRLHSRPLRRRARSLCLGAIAGGLLVAGFGPAPAAAAATPMVNLGTASTYAVISGASVGNTVSAPNTPHTIVRGDLGVKANTQPTGFPPGVVTGTINVGNSAAVQAHDDVVAAYVEIAARTGGAALAGALAGTTVGPGLHTIAGAASNTTTVTLDAGGDPNAVFVFQVNGALAFAAGSHVVLAGGAQASRVFWQVNGAGAVGANADFAGTLIAMDAVSIGANSLANGRAFARNGALTLDNNQFYSSPPAATIDGGATSYTTDTIPTISGTTDVESPGKVTVTIAGQTLMATPSSSGAWSVTSAVPLANGTYSVVASVTDAVGNSTSAAQQLTIDTVLPVVTIDGGASVTTNDPTPTLSGTSDVAAGTLVRVTVDSQSLLALVSSSGTWNVTPSTLGAGTRTVTASVNDPAANEGTDSQILTVDTAAPALTITGGSTALTNDQTPEISGTADVPDGTSVSVTLADEDLVGLVGADGSWSVTASPLINGPHRVIATVTDAAGNATRFTQTLTIDTVSPAVSITDGATRSTEDLTPTITGTSGASPGTTITVTIAGQTMTTLLQSDGGWNATPTTVGEGTWEVVASAPDPAGNIGSASQMLTIGDPDDDDDGVSDGSDNCSLIANTNQANQDGDALGDACDADDDNDQVADLGDRCPVIAGGPSGCPRVARGLTLRYSAKLKTLKGMLATVSTPACTAAQRVLIFRQKPGPDRRITAATTKATGKYAKAKALAPGSYYAKVRPVVIDNVAFCAAAKSKRLIVG